MVKRLRKRVRDRAPLATVLRAPAEDLPFNDDVFDVVVSTLVLCTVSDLPRALREIRRVLRADGRLLFLEHVRGDDPKALVGEHGYLMAPHGRRVGEAVEEHDRVTRAARVDGRQVDATGQLHDALVVAREHLNQLWNRLPNGHRPVLILSIPAHLGQTTCP